MTVFARESREFAAGKTILTMMQSSALYILQETKSKKGEDRRRGCGWLAKGRTRGVCVDVDANVDVVVTSWRR